MDTEGEYTDEITYLAKVKKDTEKVSDEDKKILQGLKIVLSQEILPQHCVEHNYGTRVPSAQEQKEIEKYVELKKGTFSPEEDQRIAHNWKKFCKIYKWNKKNPEPFFQMRYEDGYLMSRKNRKKFVQFLAQNLPNRTLYSIYHRFRNLYQKRKSSRYTQEEDEYIIDHIDRNPNLDEKRKYADLAIVLNRTRASIWRRYGLLKKMKKKKKESDMFS